MCRCRATNQPKVKKRKEVYLVIIFIHWSDKKPVANKRKKEKKT